MEQQTDVPAVESPKETVVVEETEPAIEKVEEEAPVESKEVKKVKVAEAPKPPKAPKKKKKKKVKKYAEMTFDSVIHNLPDVIEGDNFKNKFVFKNTGDVPLTIQEASSSCGCTTPNFSFLDIEPGEKSFIGVDYFSVNKDGPQEAEIIIKANTSPANTTLKMLFTVLPKEEKMKIDSLPD